MIMFIYEFMNSFTQEVDEQTYIKGKENLEHRK